MNTRWNIRTPDPGQVSALAESLGCSPIVATVLINRGIVTASDADRFLNASLGHLRPPFAIADMEKAVARIAAAIVHKQKILLFGDYDVDGITAIVLLYEFLRETGARIDFYLPHRRKEGYGIHPEHIRSVAAPGATELIITVDCGSTGHAAVQAARAAGIDMIITDHHNIADPPQGAAAVVNPKRADCTAGFSHLAGVGVVFCLLICLRKHLRDAGFWGDGSEPNLKRLTDLVALGTVADQVPLVDENRILTRIGLEQINTGSRPGITALLHACGLDRAGGADDIAFRLAPRLNAPGRMDHAEIAVRLLNTRDPATAKSLAEQLNRLNSQRQLTEKKILEDIEAYVNTNRTLLENPSLIVSGSDWHEGVLGIVASRLVEKYFRPAIVISTRDGMGKGSARGVPGLDLFGALTACAGFLETFGGHAAAAGLKIKPENIDPFRKSFDRSVLTGGPSMEREKTLHIDGALNLGDVSDDLLDALERMAPFGPGNPEPVFTATQVGIHSWKTVGSAHRQLRLQQPNCRSLPAIQFNVDPDEPMGGHFDRIAFRLRWNRWNGTKNPQIIIEETG